MWGLTTQVSTPKSITSCITAFKKKPNTRGVAPSLLSIRDILLHTVFARDKFLTTYVQLSYVSKITRPRYLKEVTIYRGIP